MVLVLAGAGFLLPQDVPLEWYPLNQPGDGVDYLEISCAANTTGEVEIRYDLARRGHQPIDRIRIPVSPSRETYTYTFPLPDAPIVEMRVAIPKNGTLTIRQMRIINRREEEVRRFTRDLFRPQHEIADIAPLPDGWRLVAAPNATDPYARLELFSQIMPSGYRQRNVIRCLLSTGYLSLMLTLLLLAVLFAFCRPDRTRACLLRIGFVAFMAVLFALVGNRGLIRNSINDAAFHPAPVDPGLRLEFDAAVEHPSTVHLLVDAAQDPAKTKAIEASPESHSGLQVLRFALPSGSIRAAQLSLPAASGSLTLYGVRVVDNGQRTRALLPLRSVIATGGAMHPDHDASIFETAAGAPVPLIRLDESAVAAVNGALASPDPFER